MSGFERRESDDWDSATLGFLYNVDKGEYLMRDINHPHSLLRAAGTVWTCESRENRLISMKGDELDLPSSYLRGLATDGRRFYVGSSKRRVVSKSTGKTNPGVAGGMRGDCCVYEMRKGSWKPRVLIDFSDVRSEIYDLLLL